MKLSEIRPIAEKYKKLLAPYCKKNKIEIAGSIRREKEECGDIELVLVRDEEQRLYFRTLVNQWEKVRGEALGRYTQRMLPEGVKLDLFMCQGDNWGNIFLQRTGNWRFSRWTLGIRAKQVGLLHRGGYLWDMKVMGFEEGIQIHCYEEEDVFRLLEMDWIEPKDREWD